MAEEIIGGHLGMDVIRELDASHVPKHHGLSRITKRAIHEKGISGDWVGVDMYDHNSEALYTEARMLNAMHASGYTPELYEYGDGWVSQRDLGDTEPPTDGELFRRNCIKMLATIRSRGLRHGDLIGSNIITRDNHPYAIDWQEGHLLTEPAPQKQPWSDSHLLMRHIFGTLDVNGQADTPRVARRWSAVLHALGADTNFTLPLKDKTFVDLGCFQGDFVALAAAEGMNAFGLDQGGFRSGEDSIEIGKALWADFPFGKFELRKQNIMDSYSWFYRWDCVMMFSTWAYIVIGYGWGVACDLLRRIVENNEVLFFETQLAGDGPGPAALKTDDDVGQLLHSLGASTVNAIATYPVTGRPASRTVWEVRK